MGEALLFGVGVRGGVDTTSFGRPDSKGVYSDRDKHSKDGLGQRTSVRRWITQGLRTFANMYASTKCLPSANNRDPEMGNGN